MWRIRNKLKNALCTVDKLPFIARKKKYKILKKKEPGKLLII